MRLPVILSAILVASATAFSAIPASAQSSAATPVSAKQELSFGSDDLQALDFWPGASANAPLVVYVHGGGWRMGDKNMMEGSDKLSHWQALGYAVASVNYRLVPDASVEDQAEDVANAVALLKSRSDNLGFDGSRIVLIGHSAGAHLVTLVGSDQHYLHVAGLDFGAIAGIVALDGAAYHVPEQMREGPRIMQRTYRRAFGEDQDRQEHLSPTLHARAPNVAEFLILHVERDDGERQSKALADALRSGGSHVELQGFAGRGLRGHMEINRDLGDPDYPATAVVDGWLAKLFG